MKILYIFILETIPSESIAMFRSGIVTPMSLYPALGIRSLLPTQEPGKVYTKELVQTGALSVPWPERTVLKSENA